MGQSLKSDGLVPRKGSTYDVKINSRHTVAVVEGSLSVKYTSVKHDSNSATAQGSADSRNTVCSLDLYTGLKH